jgi:Tol biopolymer transport system component
VSATLGEIWLFGADGTRAERMTPREVGNFTPVWSPDGRRFLYTSTTSGRFEIYQLAADRSEGPRLVPTVDSQFKFPLGFTPDGRTLVLAAYGPDLGWEVWAASVSGGGAPVRVLRTVGRRNPSGALSPDGTWLAYVSYESGQSEVYVTSFPTVGPRTRVSSGGGTNPIWTRGGKELLYLAAKGRDSTVFSVALEMAAGRAAGAPRPLLTRRGLISFAATRDGERLLLSVESGETPPPHIELTLNWTAVLDGR